MSQALLTGASGSAFLPKSSLPTIAAPETGGPDFKSLSAHTYSQR